MYRMFISHTTTYCTWLSSKIPPPQDARKKAARLIACKCTLAARVDSFHESPGGEIGERTYNNPLYIMCRDNNTSMYTYTELRQEVQKKVDKLTEPPPVKAPKPLPKPDDAPRKKRGGRRYMATEYITVTDMQMYICRCMPCRVESDIQFRSIWLTKLHELFIYHACFVFIQGTENEGALRSLSDEEASQQDDIWRGKAYYL